MYHTSRAYVCRGMVDSRVWSAEVEEIIEFAIFETTVRRDCNKCECYLVEVTDVELCTEETPPWERAARVFRTWFPACRKAS